MPRKQWKMSLEERLDVLVAEVRTEAYKIPPTEVAELMETSRARIWGFTTKDANVSVSWLKRMCRVLDQDAKLQARRTKKEAA